MADVKRRNGIGGCLRELRKALGWTQAELARVAGISTTALSRCETGKERPGLATVRALVAVLGFSGDASRLVEILMKRGVL